MRLVFNILATLHLRNPGSGLEKALSTYVMVFLCSMIYCQVVVDIDGIFTTVLFYLFIIVGRARVAQ